MDRVLGAPAWNLSLHSAPLKTPTLDHFHWHLEVIPKLTKVAGFEWGTGFFINPTLRRRPPSTSGRGFRGPRKLTLRSPFVTLRQVFESGALFAGIAQW